MYKPLFTILIVSLICWIRAADESCKILSLQELALQCVVSTLQSVETIEQYVRDPKAFESQMTFCGVNTGAIKDLIVGRLLKSYESEISCCQELVKPGQSEFASLSQALSVQWHPRKDVLAAGYSNGKIRIWDCGTDRLLHKMREDRRSSIRSLDWHPSNDNVLASGSDDCMVVIWNANTGEKLKQLAESQNSVCAVRWHPTNSDLLASGSLDGRVFIWNTKTDQLWMFRQEDRFFHEGYVYMAYDKILSLSWYKQGRLLACGSFYGNISILDEQAQLGKHYKGRDLVESMDCSPDGIWVTAGYLDGKVILWREHDDSVYIYGHPDEAQPKKRNVSSICWHPSGTWLTSIMGGGTIYIWDLQTKKVFKKFDNETRLFSSPSWHPSGRFLAAASNKGIVRIWDMKAYDTVVEQTSLMQALCMLMKHEDLIFPKGESSDKGKEEDLSVDDADIACEWETQRYMRLLEASLPYPLKDILKKK